jgi:putative ABC transport system substrate-binding protein
VRHSRRAFLTLAASAAVVASCSGLPTATVRPRRVAYLGGTPDPSTAPWIDEFRHSLRDGGYVEGQNLEFDLRWAMGDLDKFTQYVADFVKWPADVMASSHADALRAMKRATNTIPIVFTTFPDPVEAEWIGVQSLAHPGGNTTGVGTQASATVTKRLELLRETAPSIKRVAVLHDGEAQRTKSLDALTEASKDLGLELVPFVIRAANAQAELASALSGATAARTDSLLLLPSQVHILLLRKTIIDHTITRRIPASFATNGGYAEDGGLMAYGENFVDVFRRAGNMTVRILGGANPAQLPVERPEKFDLVINLKSAREIGLTVPQSVLSRATQVIE